MNDRKLASIRKVSNIRPLENADTLDVCSIDGWDVVIKKGIHKEGDLVVYIEVDSLLDENNPVFEFMRKYNFKVKSIKLRGQISQGMVLPLKEVFNDGTLDMAMMEEGDNVTEILNIKKFELEEDKDEVSFTDTEVTVSFFDRICDFFNGKFKKSQVHGKEQFPSFVKKTKEERIQNHPKKITPDKVFLVTEKLDGTSATYAMKRERRLFRKDKFEFFVCSRNLRISPKSNGHYNKIAKIHNMETVLKNILQEKDADTIYVQGEIVGNSIQGNKYNRERINFFAFTLNIDGERYPIESLVWHDIETVPVIYSHLSFASGVEGALTLSKRTTSVEGSNSLAEGIVIRNAEDYNESYKVINPDFLIKYNR